MTAEVGIWNVRFQIQFKFFFGNDWFVKIPRFTIFIEQGERVMVESGVATAQMTRKQVNYILNQISKHRIAADGPRQGRPRINNAPKIPGWAKNMVFCTDVNVSHSVGWP